MIRLKNNHSVSTDTVNKPEYLLSGAINTHLQPYEVIPRGNRWPECFV